MGIYPYKCLDCGKINEFIRSVADRESEIICPDCESVNYQRVFTAPSYSRMNEEICPGQYTEECKHPEDHIKSYGDPLD